MRSRATSNSFLLLVCRKCAKQSRFILILQVFLCLKLQDQHLYSTLFRIKCCHSQTLLVCNVVTHKGKTHVPCGFGRAGHWSKIYNKDVLCTTKMYNKDVLLISVYEDNLKSLQKMAFPLKMSICFPPLLLFSNLSDNPLSKGYLSYEVIQSMSVKSHFCSL